MGIFDRFFPKNDAHGHHEHADCPVCGAHFHDKSELEHHKATAHPKP